eukprot:g9205.t1
MSKSIQSATSFFTNTPQLTTVRPLSRRLSTTTHASLKEIQNEKVMISTAAITAAACVLPQIASAAQEVIQLAEGEPLIVQAGWAALAASFTMSIAIVVWGRSGL